MVNSGGYRRGTRDLFSKKAKKRGTPSVGIYLRRYQLGDWVDVVADPSIQKGMPHKLYHGRTGRVWNITPRGIGVEVNKRVRGRIFKKRVLPPALVLICVRAEHVRPSKCRDDHVARVKTNEAIKVENRRVRAEGGKPQKTIKRTCPPPRPARILSKRHHLGEEKALQAMPLLAWHEKL